MSTFIRLSESQIIINLDQVAYIEELPNGVVKVAFAAMTQSHFVDVAAEEMTVVLAESDAEQFLKAVMRRAENW